MKKVFRNVFTAAFLLLILIGCSTTKRIADDEVLYTGVKKMEIIPDSGVKIAGRSIYSLRRTQQSFVLSLYPHAVSHRFVGVELHGTQAGKRGEALDIREVGQGAGTCFDRTARIAYEGSQRHSRK